MQYVTIVLHGYKLQAGRMLTTLLASSADQWIDGWIETRLSARASKPNTQCKALFPQELAAIVRDGKLVTSGRHLLGGRRTGRITRTLQARGIDPTAMEVTCRAFHETVCVRAKPEIQPNVRNHSRPETIIVLSRFWILHS